MGLKINMLKLDKFLKGLKSNTTVKAVIADNDGLVISSPELSKVHKPVWKLGLYIAAVYDSGKLLPETTRVEDWAQYIIIGVLVIVSLATLWELIDTCHAVLVYRKKKKVLTRRLSA
ncbi:unnamed protein product [Vitrella brassicaformis CCMP3155]|uniref:Uncharacterized protein n=1 Tax=Vitrella brassicaformis (strain CCMP3155) TaxID=1169540 RepID=A0A0G4EDU1_VITBC|nr:unnamed protein product [Vitrella brassicaformis CCMP3155]|eukprot:CEL93703.1 unnamed protein product [Vitrella brassicaformis CCMP3155]